LAEYNQAITCQIRKWNTAKPGSLCYLYI